jgi:hypothetical protein
VVGGIARRVGRSPQVYVNATGHGDPVVELIRRHTSPATVRSVFFNHGDRLAEEGRTLTLGKAYLVARLKLLLQTGCLHLPRTAEAEELARELLDYEVTVDPDANDRYGACSPAEQRLLEDLPRLDRRAVDRAPVNFPLADQAVADVDRTHEVNPFAGPLQASGDSSASRTQRPGRTRFPTGAAVLAVLEALLRHSKWVFPGRRKGWCLTTLRGPGSASASERSSKGSGSTTSATASPASRSERASPSPGSAACSATAPSPPPDATPTSSPTPRKHAMDRISGEIEALLNGGEGGEVPRPAQRFANRMRSWMSVS